MRNIIVAALLVLGVSFSHGQAFEGKIVYKGAYKSKMSNVTDEQFTAMMGTVQEYYIKGGNYKSVWNGTFLQWQLYINKDNRIYNKMSNATTILWYDGSANVDEVIKSELNKGAATILGYLCDELILTCKSGIQKFYFTSKLGVNSKLFENHKLGNWSEYMSKAKSLPLRMSIENPQFSVETVATEVVAMKIDDKFFELPADAKIEKSSY